MVLYRRLTEIKMSGLGSAQTDLRIRASLGSSGNPQPPIVHVFSPQWMKSDTILLINTRTDLCHCPNHNGNLAHTVTRDLRKSSSTDTHCWVDTAVEEIRVCI